MQGVWTNIIRSHVACYSLGFVFANMAAAYLAYLIRSHSARLVFVFGANTNNYLYLCITAALINKQTEDEDNERRTKEKGNRWKRNAKTGDRRRQSKTSMTQQHMYLHLYEFLAAPPSVVRLQYWRGYRDRSVEKSREQYTSVISRWGGNCRGQLRTEPLRTKEGRKARLRFTGQ